MCPGGPIGAVPEWGEFGETHRLDVDVSLSVEASSGVPQLDGVDLTQSQRERQHRPVHCRICLTAWHTHIHTHSMHVNKVSYPQRSRQTETLSDNQHSSQRTVIALCVYYSEFIETDWRLHLLLSRFLNQQCGTLTWSSSFASVLCYNFLVFIQTKKTKLHQHSYSSKKRGG